MDAIIEAALEMVKERISDVQWHISEQDRKDKLALAIRAVDALKSLLKTQ